MKQTALFIGFFLLVAPSLAFAQATPTCSANGYRVVFVNGIFDTETAAKADAKELGRRLGLQYNNQPVTVQLGYNPTHLAGVGDILQTFAQQFNTSLSDYDLDTILMQIYPEVTTRKLLVVGHSQGAQYANEMYRYFLSHGEPKEAVGVYAVATPANFVAGNGKYLTSAGDKVMTAISTAAAVALQDGVQISQPLPPNIVFAFESGDQNSPLAGHSFTDDYLAEAPDRMVGDIDSELSALVPTDATPTGDCFTPPSASLVYKAQQAGFAIADPTATVIKVGAVTTLQVGAVALNTAATFAESAMQFFADTVVVTASPPTPAQAEAKTDTIINKLYGSSLDGMSAQDKKDLLGSSQGGAVVLAVTPKKKHHAPGVVLGTSTEVAPQVPAPPTPPSIFPSSSNGPVWGGGAGSPTPPITFASIPPAGDSSVVDPPTVPDEASSTDDGGDSASSTPDDTASTTPDTTTSTGSIIASQEDSSGTPSHYWDSSNPAGPFLVMDPNDGLPGYSIGNIASTTVSVIGIHIKLQFNTDGAFNALPRIPILFDESGTQVYACASLPFGGGAYGSATDAMALTNPLQFADFDGKMVDMYFQCIIGSGHDQIYQGTSYRLYFYPVSSADINDIYVAMDAAGDKPFYEISDDGTY